MADFCKSFLQVTLIVLWDVAQHAFRYKNKKMQYCIISFHEMYKETFWLDVNHTINCLITVWVMQNLLSLLNNIYIKNYFIINNDNCGVNLS